MRNFHDDQMNSPRSSARLARWSARQATSMPNLTSSMAWSFRWMADQSALRRRPLHVPQGCDHPDIREAGVRLHDRPPSSRTGMHVRREARLVDDHRCGVELSPAPIPHFSQARRTDPTHPTKGFRQIGGCPEPTLNEFRTPVRGAMESESDRRLPSPHEPDARKEFGRPRLRTGAAAR